MLKKIDLVELRIELKIFMRNYWIKEKYTENNTL